MDNTIKIITDSGCDISTENAERYKDLLEIIPFMVTINGKSYADRRDIQPDEFYKILKEQQVIPKHSQITAIQFEEKYRELYEQGIRTIIVDVINAAPRRSPTPSWRSRTSQRISRTSPSTR